MILKSVCCIWVVLLLLQQALCRKRLDVKSFCETRCQRRNGGALCNCNANHFVGKRHYVPGHIASTSHGAWNNAWSLLKDEADANTGDSERRLYLRPNKRNEVDVDEGKAWARLLATFGRLLKDRSQQKTERDTAADTSDTIITYRGQ